MALAVLLDQHPDAALVRHRTGRDLASPCPKRSRRVATTSSPPGRPLDLIAPEDRVVVIGAWERAHKTGAPHADVVVRLADEPERTVTLHFIDAHLDHGVFLGVFVPTDDEESGDRFAFNGRSCHRYRRASLGLARTRWASSSRSTTP